MEEKMISVVMATYNDEKYIAQAIESILNQTYYNFEFIIINDGSTDRTEDIIKRYTDSRIVYVKNEKNRGLAYSLNRGLELAQGQYIARMDGDDISKPVRFEKQVAYMEKHTDLAVIGCSAKYIGRRQGLFEVKSNPKELKAMLLENPSLIHPGYMFRRKVIEKGHYRYDSNFMAEDYELLSRIAEKHAIGNVHRVLLEYRVHQTQITTAKRKELAADANKIRNRWLLKLGIRLSQKQLNMYSDIILKWDMYNIKETLFLIWLYMKVNRQNKKYLIFDQCALKKVQKERLKNHTILFN